MRCTPARARRAYRGLAPQQEGQNFAARRGAAVGASAATRAVTVVVAVYSRAPIAYHGPDCPGANSCWRQPGPAVHIGRSRCIPAAGTVRTPVNRGEQPGRVHGRRHARHPHTAAEQEPKPGSLPVLTVNDGPSSSSVPGNTTGYALMHNSPPRTWPWAAQLVTAIDTIRRMPMPAT